MTRELYDINRAKYLNLKTEGIDDFEKSKIIEEIKELCAEAIKYGDDEFLINLYKLLIIFYLFKKEIQSVFDYAFRTLALLEKHHDEVKKLVIYSYIIQAYQLIGDYEKAQVYINDAIEISLALKNNDRIAAAYYNASLQYEYLNNVQGQRLALEKCISYGEQAAYKRVLGHAYANISNLYKKEKSYDDALKFIDVAIQIAKDTSSKQLLGFATLQKAVLLREFNLFEEALIQVEISIEIHEQIEHQLMIIESVIEKVRILFLSSQYETALQLSNTIQFDAATFEMKSYQLQLLELQHQIYNRIHNSKSAYQYLIEYVKIKEELFNETSNKRIQNLEITHQVHQIKKEKEFAENMAKLKHDFLANMSHEIRTPINNIMGLSFLLQEENEKHKQNDFAHRIHKSAQNLLDLINDILDISKIEAGKFDLIEQAFSLSQLIDNIKSIVQFRAEEKGLAFTIDNQIKDDYFKGDAVRIQQILINIIANAIKFTQKGSVFFTIYQNEKNEIVFNIKDTGIGIEEDKLQTIFDAYEQASSNIKTTFGGTGLGLSIAKKLVDKMKGEIIVNSEKDKGTTFQIMLPLIAIENNIEEKSTKTKNLLDIEKLNDLCIYFADDNEENRNVLIEILQYYNASIQVFAFENGQSLLDELLQKNTLPHLIITDIDMPVLNGFELIQILQSNEKTASIPVIATTSSLLLNEKEDVLLLGFCALLQNPTPPQTLIETILECITLTSS